MRQTLVAEDAMAAGIHSRIESAVDSDIKKAETLPAAFYKSQEVCDRLKEDVLMLLWNQVFDDSLWSQQLGSFDTINCIIKKFLCKW